jgi:hypothetical protein
MTGIFLRALVALLLVTGSADASGQWYSGADHHFEGDVTPMKTDTYDLGETGLEWGHAYIDDATFTGTVALGSSAPTMAVTASEWVPARLFSLDGTADPGTEVVNSKFTYAFADVTTDEDVLIEWGIPDDLDDTADVTVQVLYLCDQASPTEGLWNLSYLAVGDDDADAALTTGLTATDTPSAQNDWNLASALTIPAAAIASTDSMIYMQLFHDVDDPFCGAADVNVLGVKISYTTDTNY